jgi:predicted dehydrogenase
MARRTSKGLIRVGVVGIGRGYGFARAAGERMGMKLVALCDVREGERGRQKNFFTFS